MAIFASKDPTSLRNKPLTRDEQAALEAAIQTVRRGLSAFIEAGKALLKIKDGQLYRQTAPTFEQFAEQTFGLTGRRLNQIIDASGIALAIAQERPDLVQPTTESQVRPLVGLKAAQAVEAWEEAVEASDGEIPTGVLVEEAAAKRKPARKKKKIAKPVRLRVPGATVIVEPNKAFQTVESALLAALEQVRQSASKAA